MKFFRSERFSAIALAVAAVLGLVVANSTIGPDVIAFFNAHGSTPLHVLNLSFAHWVTDGLLVVFFFIVAVELRQEFTVGDLNTPAKALAPAIAALGGVLAPALIYFTIAGASEPNGWPVPTATDIAFSLGLIALVGKNLPKRIRVFLLALAVLDDLIAILIIAVVFTSHIDFVWLGAAAVTLAAFWLTGKMQRLTGLRNLILVLLAFFTWSFVLVSGVHATIAGVALGLVLAPAVAGRAAHSLMPWSNALILPLFAFISALVVFPHVKLSELNVAFWAIVIALPVGKILGISIAGTLVGRFADRSKAVLGWDLITVSAVAGIGFTVSLLMNELAFVNEPEVRDQCVLAVLSGSAISILVGGSLVAWRARVGRREQRVE